MTNLILGLYLLGGIAMMAWVIADEENWGYVGELCLIIILWVPLLLVTLYRHVIYKLIKRKFPKISHEDNLRITTLFTNAKKAVFHHNARWLNDLRFVLCGRKKQMEIAHYMGEFYDEVREKNIIRQTQIGSMKKN